MAEVRDELCRLGASTLMLDQRDIATTEIDLTVGKDTRGSIRVQNHLVDFEAIMSVYVRTYDSHAIPAVVRAGPGSALWQHATLVEDTLWSWLEITPSLVVNRLAAMSTNGSKPYQLSCIRRHGFAIPDTLVTTDPEAVELFWDRHRSIIYKSSSGIRSIVSTFRPEHRERLADVKHCPTQFQQYVAGRDHRAHVVGTEVFTCEVISNADDYRYPGESTVELRACRLPQEVEDRCRLLASSLGLLVAGIDLRRTPEDEWYCFEVNPSPAFSYFAQEANLPIASAIARLLMGSRDWGGDVC